MSRGVRLNSYSIALRIERMTELSSTMYQAGLNALTPLLARK